MILFSGNSNIKLANQIAINLLMNIGNIKVEKFSDGEISVEILDNVRGQDAYVIQSICYPANDHLMELLLITDALKRASVRSVSAIIPYFGYARQDRRPRSARVPISARLVADLMQTAGIKRIITVELHADQIQGFFRIPVDNVYSTKIFADDINHLQLPNLTIVSPDVGGVLRARSLAKQVGDSELVIIDKRRPKANESEVMNIIGDVNEKNCIIVDDIVDTGGTLVKAVNAIFAKGANTVRAYISHPVMSGDAFEIISNSRITELVITDSIPFNCGFAKNIRQISLANTLSEVILRISNGVSIKDLS